MTPSVYTQSLSDLLGASEHELAEPARYRVGPKLGAGGMGSVFSAYDTKLRREVAIKVVDRLGPKPRERFFREAHALATLTHPNIIRVFDYSGATVERPFIVMERLHGRSLQSHIDAGPIDEATVVAVLHELASALRHAHAAGVLHRDLKPDNILIEPDGRVVLIDFGLAKGIEVESARSELTHGATQVVGTPAFASPEQLSGGGVLTEQSDLFSLGSTVYYALTQVFPFRGTTPFDVIREVMIGAPLPLASLTSCSPELERLVGRLLEKPLDVRCANANEVLTELRPLLVRHHIHVPSDSVRRRFARGAQAPTSTATTLSESARPTMPLPRKRSGAPRWLALSGVVIAGLVIAGVVAWRYQAAAPAEVTVASAALPASAPAVQTPALPSPASTVIVRLSVIPWGHVSIDGIAYGTTPLRNELLLTTGAHEVEVRHPKFGVTRRTLSLAARDRPYKLEIDLTAEPQTPPAQ